MTHPNLIFSASDIEGFRQKLAGDGKLRERYEKQTAPAEEYLAEDYITEAQANGGNLKSQHADFGSLNGQANRFFSVLGLKYIADGDARCAEKMKGLLLHLITFERWHSVNYCNRTPVPWHCDLCSTATTLALAKIYDLIYPVLTQEERKKICAGILKNGVYASFADWVLPETRIHALDSMGHNWWSVCISEAACAFLAVSDFIPEAEKKRVLTLVNEALASYLTYSGSRLFNKFGNFDDRGLFYESINYDNYGTGSLLRYLYCYERYYGRNETVRNALPQGLCDAPVILSYPCTRDGKLFYEFMNFGDHSPGTTMDFFAKTSVLTGLATSALKACASTYGSSVTDELIGYRPYELKGDVKDLPESAFFSSGYAVKRSSWEPDATLLTIKSGYCWNHSHNDSGTFMIFDKGRALFTDSGTCLYDEPEYHAYYCQDAAHSVLKTGAGGRRDEELYRGTRFPGGLTDRFETEDMFFVQADTTGPLAHLCSRAYRNFFWLDDRILVIFDDVYCHKDDTAVVTFHFDAWYKLNGNAAELDNGLTKARLISHFPGEMTVTEKAGHADHREKETVPYLEFSTKEKRRAHLLIHTAELENGEKTQYERLSGENAEGLRVTAGNVAREFWFNIMADGHVMHDNSNNVIAGYETDAYMLVITRDLTTGRETVLSVCGSYLRKDGRTFDASFAKKTGLSVTKEGNG